MKAKSPAQWQVAEVPILPRAPFTQCPGFLWVFLISRGAHTTSTTQACGGIRSAWLLVSASPHSSGNVAFVDQAKGDGLYALSFTPRPTTTAWLRDLYYLDMDATLSAQSCFTLLL